MLVEDDQHDTNSPARLLAAGKHEVGGQRSTAANVDRAALFAQEIVLHERGSASIYRHGRSATSRRKYCEKLERDKHLVPARFGHLRVAAIRDGKVQMFREVSRLLDHCPS